MADLFTIGMKADTSQLRRGKGDLDNFAKAGKGVETQTQKTTSAIRGATAAITSFISVAGAIQSLRIADQYQLMNDRIRLATEATGDFAKVQSELFRVSQQTGTGLQNNVELFDRIRIGAQELGKSNIEVLQLVEAIDQLGASGGTSQTALGAATTQLSQALAGGILRAEEFNSVVENTPKIAQAIAEGLNTSIGGLRTMVLDGKVLAEDVFTALLSQSDKIADNFEKMPIRLGRSTTAFSNSITKLLGELDEASGLSSGFASSIDGLSKSIDSITEDQDELAKTLGIVYNLSGAIAGAAVVYGTYRGALILATAAQTAFNIAARANPLGLLLVGAGALTGYMLSLKTETEEAAASIDQLTKSVGSLNDQQKELEITRLGKQQLEIEEKVLGIREKMEGQSGRMRNSNRIRLEEQIGLLGKVKNAIQELQNSSIKPIIMGQDEVKNKKSLEDQIGLTKALMYEYQIYQQSRIDGENEYQGVNIDTLSTYEDYSSTRIEGEMAYQASLANTVAIYATVKTELEQLKEAQDKLQYASMTANPDQMAGIQDALDNVNAQIANLDDPFKSWSASLADAASGMSQFTDATDESGKSTAKLQVAMAALNAVQAINGVINQSGGDPYTAFGRMATMAAAMAALGQSVGGLGGSNSDTSAEAQKTQGTGSVLGFFDAKSESIANSLDLIETINDSLLGVNQSMLNELKNLNNAITGASNQVARNVSFDGIGQLGNFSKNPLEDFNPLAILGDFFDFGGMLGGSSDVSNEGINIVGGTIADIVNNTTALAFQDVQTKKYAWSSSRTRTYTKPVADSVEAQFDNLYTSIVDTVAAGASAIGLDDGAISDVLSNFIFDSVNISLKGLDAEGKTAALEAIFSKAFDDLASSMLPFLSEFQNAGEGFGETLSRISTELAVAQKAADRLGQSINQGVVGNIRLADVMSEVSGGAESLATNISGFTDNFYSSSEQAAFLLSDLNGVLSELGISLPMTEKGFRDLVEAQNINTIAGAENIATLLDLQDEASEYYNLLEESTAVFDSITDFVRELMGLAADGTATLSSAKSAYESALNAAIGGDKDAIADLSSLAQTYLNLTADSVSTGAELRAAQQAVIGQLTGLTGTIPAYANGTDYHAGGWAMVGEQGPELVNLPTGSSVKTNSETNSMMNQTAVVDAINRLISLTNGGFSVLAKNSKVMAEYMEVWDNEGLLINSTTPIRVETV
jgi:tape measure domain-containing protein